MLRSQGRRRQSPLSYTVNGIEPTKISGMIYAAEFYRRTETNSE